MGRAVKQLKHSWNLFRDAPQDPGFGAGGMSMASGFRQSRAPSMYFNDKSIIGAIYNRLSVDLSSIEFMHCIIDDGGTPTSLFKDALHNALTLDPNIDQSAQVLKADIAMTMFESGHSAIVPIDADFDPTKTSYNIKQLRVGRVVGWFAQRVTVEVYDDREEDDEGNPINGGIHKQVTVPKSMVAIVPNPFFTTMNEPSGLLQRLIRKLSILDSIDEAAGSGKLDLIFQLPYTVRGESRKEQAEQRRAALAEQLKDDELGIGYIDVSEKVIQLNRPIENKLLDQVTLLLAQVKTELGITDEIMNGTASRDTINNYYDRTIEPIANGIAQELKRKFLTKAARTRGHSIEIYRDPLKLIPLSELAEIVDKLLRNKAITANEIRPKIGFMPSKDPSANELINPNMPNSDQTVDGAPKEVDNGEGSPGSLGTE